MGIEFRVFLFFFKGKLVFINRSMGLNLWAHIERENRKYNTYWKRKLIFKWNQIKKILHSHDKSSKWTNSKNKDSWAHNFCRFIQLSSPDQVHLELIIVENDVNVIMIEGLKQFELFNKFYPCYHLQNKILRRFSIIPNMPGLMNESTIFNYNIFPFYFTGIILQFWFWIKSKMHS